MSHAGRQPSSDPNEDPMDRWPPEIMAELKSYLESKSDEFTKDDYYLAVEWLMQRYLPQDINRTEREHQDILRSFYKKVDAAIQRMERGEPPPEVKDDPDFAQWLNKTLYGGSET